MFTMDFNRDVKFTKLQRMDACEKEMALIVMFLSLFSFSLVYHVVAQNNLSDVIKVNMKCRCGAVGFKTVNIIWRPLPQDQDSSYRVYFSTDTKQYKFGCTVNTTHQSLYQNELQCSITSQSLFPFSFYFKMEMTNSSGVYVTGRKTCRLASCVRCTKPQKFKVVGSGRRNLTVSWEPAPYMGGQTPLLCYRILYASVQGKANESVKRNGEGESTLVHTFYDLNPYTVYRFYIQCSFSDCLNGWGALSGPVTGMTKEQAPAKAPEFENWSVSNIEDGKRDVTVMWKLPPPNTWNGVPKKFAINFWQVALRENHSLTPIPNSSRSLQTKNGSVNKATLPGLNRFADYQSQISMCNTDGCGPRSKPWLFKGDTEQNKLGKAQSESANASFPWIIVGSIIGPVFLVLILVVVAVLLWKKTKERKRRKNHKPLGERLDVGTPTDYDELVESTPSTSNYSEIQHDEGNTDVLIQSDMQTNHDNGDLDNL